MKKKLESVNKEIKYRLLEEKAVSSLIRWAKSEELCFDEVQKKVDDWLIFFINHNAPIKKEDLIFHREMAIDILIIRCISKCSSDELSELDSIKVKLAQKVPSIITNYSKVNHEVIISVK